MRRCGGRQSADGADSEETAVMRSIVSKTARARRRSRLSAGRRDDPGRWSGRWLAGARSRTLAAWGS